mmetsp:Transcript_52139/g.92946  ORF Transcript_52139/g.92946 Transcript_52139/m.92946 type:complete len:238 (+) Transcript_52139:2570-3283(+)
MVVCLIQQRLLLHRQAQCSHVVDHALPSWAVEDGPEIEVRRRVTKLDEGPGVLGQSVALLSLLNGQGPCLLLPLGPRFRFIDEGGDGAKQHQYCNDHEASGTQDEDHLAVTQPQGPGHQQDGQKAGQQRGVQDEGDGDEERQLRHGRVNVHLGALQEELLEFGHRRHDLFLVFHVLGVKQDAPCHAQEVLGGLGQVGHGVGVVQPVVLVLGPVEVGGFVVGVPGHAGHLRISGGVHP